MLFFKISRDLAVSVDSTTNIVKETLQVTSKVIFFCLTYLKIGPQKHQKTWILSLHFCFYLIFELR